MANKANSLSHTKWLCKYHIVFTPKYRRKIIYNQYAESVRDIIRQLCAYKRIYSSISGIGIYSTISSSEHCK